jgi:hypothetical protein
LFAVVLEIHTEYFPNGEGNFRVLVGSSEGSRTRRRYEDNIEMDLEELGWEGVDWIKLVWDSDRLRAVLNAVMTSRVP